MRQAGRERAGLKHREALHHVEEAIRRLLKREFSALLRESRSQGNGSIEPGSIHLATNRIRIELLAVSRDRPSLWLDLEERSGILAAGISRLGWLESSSAAERLTLADALAGLYKISGVELVHTPGGPVDTVCSDIDGGCESRMPAGSVDLTEVVIPWRAWVETWEGKPLPVIGSNVPVWRAGILPEQAPLVKMSD
jgi:hypothetical protein